MHTSFLSLPLVGIMHAVGKEVKTWCGSKVSGYHCRDKAAIKEVQYFVCILPTTLSMDEGGTAPHQ